MLHNCTTVCVCTTLQVILQRISYISREIKGLNFTRYAKMVQFGLRLANQVPKIALAVSFHICIQYKPIFESESLWNVLWFQSMGENDICAMTFLWLRSSSSSKKTETKTTGLLAVYLLIINTGASFSLTHWGRVTHICVGQLTIIGSDNGLSPGRRQANI